MWVAVEGWLVLRSLPPFVIVMVAVPLFSVVGVLMAGLEAFIPLCWGGVVLLTPATVLSLMIGVSGISVS